MNNNIKLVGDILSPLTFETQTYGEKFYKFELVIPRKSGIRDIIPVVVSERLMYEELSIGDKVIIEGEFRSYNEIVENGQNHLKLFAFAKEITKFNVVEVFDDDWYENQVTLKGFLCREPIYRITPFGREISDLMLAVNRKYNKSDYIPCITWGRSARYIKEFSVGTEIEVKGRLQSRTYHKKISEQNIETKTAYEVSVNSIEIINE